ncbi:Antitoxin of toxin-antitoxin stability system [Bordetella ansorpii]|uniref:Antitoxin of toxin-antitoxin stability system n=1 Tax=Bordetella ansorpii TaxID=288768 RepID=A0A157QPX3_9BORD|nr:Antitoxin of toxin-antitoxin stability system [Bordetella ansorpii]
MKEENTVSLLELDRKLSKIIRQARNGQVLVTNRNKPWVRIVTLKANAQAHQVPAKHPLRQLRKALELDGAHAIALWQAVADPPLGIIPASLSRALLLQMLYSIDTFKKLYEKIGYNLAFRHFVGVEPCGCLWPYRQFERAARAMSQSSLMAAPAEIVLAHPITESENGREFRIDDALLHRWRAQANLADSAAERLIPPSAGVLSPSSALPAAVLQQGASRRCIDREQTG